MMIANHQLCDKTGTMTKNSMELQEEMPIFAKGVGRNDVLTAAALATKWKEPLKNAIDTMLLNSFFDPDDDLTGSFELFERFLKGDFGF